MSKFPFFPQGECVGFVSEQTTLLSLNNINQFIFVMVTRCVFFAVEAEI
jgi:hypothetical protein